MAEMGGGRSAENDALHEYEVWSTYKVTGVAYVRAKTAAAAVERALDTAADDPVQFVFGEPWGETKMRARRVIPPAKPATEAEAPDAAEPHGADWSGSLPGEGPSCVCGYNGTPEDCASARNDAEGESR